MRSFLFTAATCLGLAFGCAPLPPQATVVTAANGDPTDAVTVMPTPALEAYRARRATTVDDPASYYRPWIAVLPFDGKSGFRDGVWDLRNEPARLLADEMERSVAWRVVPYAAVVEVVGAPPRRWEEQHLRQIIDALEADMVLTGDLLDYNMERMTVGDPLIGGYKSYKGIAELEVQLIRADNQRIGNAHSQQESLDRGVGLDLLGKPREQDRQFAGLGQMEYGSKEFRSTAIGQATIAAMDEVMQQLAQLVRPQGIQVSSGAAQILSVLGDELFVNVGSENGVHKGYRFAVYPSHQHVEGLDPAHRIAIVEVEDIIGARVSRVIALSGGGSIGVGDRLELIGIDP